MKKVEKTSIDINENRIFLESPINDSKDDDFGAKTYAEQLFHAIKRGAKFIAIDGEYGTGKSSIVNLFRTKIYNNDNKKEENVFVNINFININESNPIEEKEDNNIINTYHRYFVNQVGNCLYKNPYNIEKTFYNNRFSYTTISLKDNTIYKKIIDKLLLILIGFLSIYLIYSGFFKSIEILKDVYNTATKMMPYVLFLTFVLLILYGYGFYKPEKVDKSPMLDIDKCKNNLCKVLYNTMSKNGNVYFIIDDLDRIDRKLQLPIISLLYNEYYHLDSVLKNINVKFIFMIDLNKINNDVENDINSDKLFDYIINVSNNQPIILRNYIETQILNNEILNDIFSQVKNKDYIVGIIANNYNSIRKVKHLFNRIVTKYLYLNDKKINDINYSQLLIISILIGLDSIEDLNKKLNGLVNENSNKFTEEPVDLIIEEAYSKGMIDNNYYIYLSNFIDVNNLLNSNEQFIYYVANDIFPHCDNWNKVYKILEDKNIDLSKIYNQIYKYLPNNEKILLLGDKKIYNYVQRNYDLDVDTTDFYKNDCIDIKFMNYKEYKYFLNKGTFCQSLDEVYYEYINKDEDDDVHELENFWQEFKIFICHLKSNIKYYDLTKYLDNLSLTEEIFDLLISQKEQNIPVVYNMLLDKKISWSAIKQFINIELVKDICKIDDVDLKLKLENYILQNDFDLNIKKYIILNEEYKFTNIEKVYNEFISNEDFKLSEDDLKIILDKYGYNVLIDKYIIELLDDKSSEKNIIEYLKKKEYNLSVKILEKIDALTTKYDYPNYYEKLFKQKKYYRLLLYSKMINTKRLILDSCLANNKKYIEDICKVYLLMGNDFKKYAYSQGITNKIVDNLDFSKITYNKNNYWKIDILIPSLKNYNKCLNLFNRLNECNIINDYISYCRRNRTVDINFLEHMRMYSQEMNLSPGIKSNITKLINSEKEKVKR